MATEKDKDPVQDEQKKRYVLRYGGVWGLQENGHWLL
jgi:hypothetical protein